ncbi:hypothetical protein [Phytohabitans houttuyneae]|uniref:Uncharacterized protein n=1 Tax=Phytohabitans houttuyneae TaxID=1076126 RepID=A0A6V8KFJ8_9ACTN|nr:hypothetical protein [Phytohabitans houttuyneae]GFJ79505.1 hypothetical protein Phou_036850 [Phytohabitans houttuyneae]
MSFAANRIYWVPDLADPTNPTEADLGAAVDLGAYLAGPLEPALDGEAADAMVGNLLADLPAGAPAPRVASDASTASLAELFESRLGARLGSLLGRIDAAVDGLCPCGAEPREGSAYCSSDCEPTHISRDTDTNGPGQVSGQHGVATAMRWRPDLVLDAPDEDLTPIGVGERLNVGDGLFRSAFRRADGTVHLRLDDGHRFVGCDIPAGAEVPAAYGEAWERLERELTNHRHLVPSDRRRSTSTSSPRSPCRAAAG